MFREGQALRPTKSEWDSAVLEGLCGERGCCPFAMVVEWKGSVQREERAPPLRKARGIVWVFGRVNVSAVALIRSRKY